MKKVVAAVVIIFDLAICLALRQPVKRETIGVPFCLQYYKQASAEFTGETKALQQAVAAITSDSLTVVAARTQLAACRKSYKKIEFFVEYFLESRIKIFNKAPVYEVEEPYMEFQQPIGMQAMEAILFDDSVLSKKADLISQAEVIHTTAGGLMQYLYGKEITDTDILDALRLELVRIYTLGITGYDAPELKTGISEAYEAMQAVQQNLQPYLAYQESPIADSIRHYLQYCLSQLSSNTDFNSFNRADFFTKVALPLQQQLGGLIQNLHLRKKGEAILADDAPHLFSRGSIRIINTADTSTKELVALGKKLFGEPLLSGNGLRSCATCHNPTNYFTDGQVTSVAFNGKDRVQRNAPSLLYTAYQHNQFLDGRAANLPAQMLAVLTSPLEMNAEPTAVIKKINSDPTYRQLFKNAFRASENDSIVTVKKIAAAISSYEQSFQVRSSAFDRYMNGNRKALTNNQLQGFNLFMGKGMCATCHFAPLFNGLLPPAYATTEVESLGLTRNTDFKKPVADTDSGRYKFFPVSFYIGSFKTPTVRNVARTAPYMHNGAFATLLQVLNFYNKGGGNGMGLHNSNQTLSSKPLYLTQKEINNIIHFLEALTDEPAD